MSEDWDLFAVVRSCTSSVETTKLSGDEQQEQKPVSYLNIQEPQESSNSCNELHDSCKPFFLKQEQGVLESQEEKQLSDVLRVFPNSVSSSSSSVFVFRGQRDQQQQLLQQSHTPPVRSRKRKNQQKRTICHVTQENLSCDMWAWRKYGQKPIKGSPYPRNYYRCSSSKGCLARKQVERSNLDPNIFIVTYTGEHTHPPPTHRNSLAGSTRNKSQPIPKPQPKVQELHLSPNTPLNENDDVQGDEELMEEEEEIEEEEEDENDDVDDLLIPNLTVKDQDRDDLFSNMQVFTRNFPSCSAGSAVDRRL